MINYGLNLLGVRAEINFTNPLQLDFYNDSGYIESKIMEDGIYANFIDNENYVYKFKYRIFSIYGPKFDFEFVKSSLDDKNVDFKLGLVFSASMWHPLEEIELYSKNFDDEFKIKKFHISEDSICAELNNEFEQDEKCGKSRKIKYHEQTNQEYAYISMKEFVDENEYKYLGSFGNTLITNDSSTGELSEASYDYETFNVLKHPRNKETIQHVVSEYEKLIPGITDLIIDRFPLYNKIMCNSYDSDEGIIDSMIQDTIIDKCDINNVEEAKQRNKKRR